MNTERNVVKDSNNIYNIFKENMYLANLKEQLDIQFLDFDSAVEKYIVYTKQSLSNDRDSDFDKAEEQDKVRQALKQIISALNSISMMFEQIGYTNSASVSSDVDESNFQNQLKQYSKQASILSKNFSKDYFTAFSSQTYYLAALAEFHYTENYGPMTEDEDLSEKQEVAAEEANEILKELPANRTNELD